MSVATNPGDQGGVGVPGRAGWIAGLFQVTSLTNSNILIGTVQDGPFPAPSTQVFRVDATGKGFFNGGTQVGGADFAESMPVSGDSKLYEPGDVLVIDSRTTRTLDKSRNAYATNVAGVYSTRPGVLATMRSSASGGCAAPLPANNAINEVPIRVS